LTEDDKLGVAATNQTFMLDLSLAAAFQEHRWREGHPGDTRR
jgi:hypothetical protein